MSTASTPSPTAESSPDVLNVVVKCANLTKIFRDFWLRNRVRAVDGIELEIRRGEVFGLLGPNGSGKSTTVKLILGLLHRTSGQIVVFGRRPEDVATKKQIGFLPEESYLYRFLTARETLDYYGRLFHQDRAQRQRRIDMLLKMVGLEAVQRRPVGEYSKGMQRRIGLAQALINDPQLLILDEPTTGLDPIGTRQIKDLILELKRRGKTVLLCSHLLADVEDVCDRVAIMYGGKIRSQGPVGELLVRQDLTTIHTPQLDGDTIEQIDQLLRQQGKAIDRVEQPRQKLESYFLDIVHKALTEGATTSGAEGSGPLAEFLVDEARAAHMPEDVEAGAVIDRLMGDTAMEQPEMAAPADPIGQAAEPKREVDEEVIDTLVTSDSSVESASEAEQPDRAVPDEELPDESFIDALTKVEHYEENHAAESKETESRQNGKHPERGGAANPNAQT